MPEHEELSEALPPRACPACGGEPQRREARFCATCGRSLNDDTEYHPADAVRSSYHHQRRLPSSERADSSSSSSGGAAVNRTARHERLPGSDKSVRGSATHASAPRRIVKRRVRTHPGRSGDSRRPRDLSMPFTKNSNGVATTALALVTYALVPYLGILFCPGAVLLGGVGLVRAIRAPHVGGRRTSVLSVVMGLMILCAQLLLWWILYKVPEWTRQP